LRIMSSFIERELRLGDRVYRKDGEIDVELDKLRERRSPEEIREIVNSVGLDPELVQEISPPKLGELVSWMEIVPDEKIVQPLFTTEDLEVNFGGMVDEDGDMVGPYRNKWFTVLGTDLVIKVNCGYDTIINLKNGVFDSQIKEVVLSGLRVIT